MADLKVGFDRAGFKVNLVYLQQFREWAGDLLGNTKVRLSNYYQFMAGYWEDVANVYAMNAITISNVITQKQMQGGN